MYGIGCRKHQTVKKDRCDGPDIGSLSCTGKEKCVKLKGCYSVTPICTVFILHTRNMINFPIIKFIENILLVCDFLKTIFNML